MVLGEGYHWVPRYTVDANNSCTSKEYLESFDFRLYVAEMGNHAFVACLREDKKLRGSSNLDPNTAQEYGKPLTSARVHNDTIETVYERGGYIRV